MGSVLRSEGGRATTGGAAADCRCHQMWLHCDSKKKKTKQEQRGGGVGGAVGLFPNNIGINDDNEGKEGKSRGNGNKTKHDWHDRNTESRRSDEMKRVTADAGSGSGEEQRGRPARCKIC